jgi:hypothetical protein
MASPRRKARPAQHAWRSITDAARLDLERRGWHLVPADTIAEIAATLRSHQEQGQTVGTVEGVIRAAAAHAGLSAEESPEGWVIRNPAWRAPEPTHTALF